jgi:hypothetical protein
MRPLQVILILCFLGFVSPILAQTTYSKSAELPAIHISTSDLQDLLQKAHSLLSAANASAKPKYVRETIKIGENNLSVDIGGHDLGVGKIPKVFHSFEYSFDSDGNASVARINIRLGDYSRALTVSGTNPDQVDAIFSGLRDEMERSATSFGGSGLRLGVGMITFVILFIALFVLAIAYFDGQKRDTLVPIVLILALLILLFVLPLNEMLTGFVAVSGDASFIVRYGPEISVAAFILGLLSFPFTLIPLLKRGNAAADSSKIETKGNTESSNNSA